MHLKSNRTLVVLAPLALIALCASTQYLVGLFLGIWAWIPTMLVFWTSIAVLISRLGGAGSIGRWLQPAQGSWLWVALAIGAGLLSIPGFLAHWQLILEPRIFLLWLAFALINPWFEEAFWRGLLLDATRSWSATLSIAYSATWFALSHPLIWGIHSIALRQWPTILALFFVGAVWAVAYRRSMSIRWTIAGHMLANLLGLSVPVLLNMYDPAAH
jgi:membrane protease YdiL (CAAX protease family)